MPQDIKGVKLFTAQKMVLDIKPLLHFSFLLKYNKLNEEPKNPDAVYIYNGKKYGQPKFRFKTIPATELNPESDAFNFERDESTGEITLRSIIEVYRDEPDVIPLSILKPSILLSFESAGKKVEKQLTITQSPSVNAVNISQNLHAQTSIAKSEIQPLLIQLRSATGIAAFQISVKAELWWQTPVKPNLEGRPFIASQIGATHLFSASIAKDIVPKTLGKRKLSFQNLRPNIEAFPKPQAPKPQQNPAGTEIKFTDPQKIDLNAIIGRAYTKDDELVFGSLAEEFGTKDKAWKIVTIPKVSETYTIAYQPTSQLDVFNFLPQEFRIKAKEQNGDPRISISMIAGENDKPETYKIFMAITLVPYYNALAKKDLYRELNKITKGLTKFCELRLGGYKSVRFELRSVYSGENAVLTGKIPETIAEIDPVNGFVLTVECKFDSFDNFRREIGENEGIIIGDIAFELLSAEEGDEPTKIHKVPVVLNISKLAGVNLSVNADVDQQEEINVIKGIHVNNTNNFDVLLKGIDITLLSQIEGCVYDAEYEPVMEASWPSSLKTGSIMPIAIKPETDEDDEPEIWTDIVCEPYGISILNEPGKVLERLIDFATGDPQVWRLEISCPLFERWNDLDDIVKAPFSQVNQVITEIKNEKGQIFSVKLNIGSPISTLEMSRSISEILKSQQLNERKYQYRVGTIYIINPPHWTDWLIPESTATDFLSVNPQAL